MGLVRRSAPAMRLICSGSLAIVLLAGCGEEPVVPDAGLDAAVAPPVEVVDVGSDAGLVLDAAVDPLEHLRGQIQALRELLAGRLPTDLDPQSLFEADLLDEEARAQRIGELEARIAHRGTDAGVPDAGHDAGEPLDADAPDAEPLDGELPEAGPVELDAGFDAGPPDAGFDAGDDLDGGFGLDAGFDAGFDAAVPAPLGELEVLELERDALRLAFLRLPASEQRSVIEAVRERRRIAIEEHASRANAERAARTAEEAESASDDLFSRAAGSTNAVESALLAEQARLEVARAELARWEVRFANRRQEQARANAGRLTRLHELDRRLPHLEEEAADGLYEDVVEELVGERAELRARLDELDAPSRAPAFELGLNLSDPSYRGLDATRELRASVAELGRDHARSVAEEQRLRWEWTERTADDLRALDALRVELLEHCSGAKRRTVLGLGAEGRAQLSRELDQIAVFARYWLRQTWHDLPQLPGTIGGLALEPGTRVPFALAFLIFLAIGITWRQREDLTERLRTALHARTGRGEGWRSLVRPFWAVIGPLLVPLAALIALHVLAWLLDELGDSLFVDALSMVALRVAWFVFLVTLITRFLVSRLRHGAGRATIAHQILASVRLVMGFGLAVVIITDLSELLVGHGYLYGLVVDVAWLGALPIAIVLTHRWADTACEAHQARWPAGFVARALGRADSRWRRYVLTPFAGFQLTVFGGWGVVQELGLRFDQFRKALAFLFRRRLERRAERVVDESHVETLPDDVRDAFTERPTDRALEIDRFPEMERIQARVLKALDPEERGFVLALVGERGIGKTTYLRELARRVEGETVMLDVPHRLTTSEDLCLWLSGALGLSRLETIDELATALDAMEPRVVILDHCQNLVVRAIGGTVGLEALVELTARTSRTVVWICSFARYTWRYLGRARQRQDLFRDHLVLEPWSEEDIATLIRHRMEVAGREASFRDLVVEQLAGNALEDAVLRTEGEYLRLLWDFASGNPRIAIHFWKHSLVEDEDGLKVRLFAAPSGDELEDLHETSLFLLATIALHENATVAEASTSVGAPTRECSALLSYLRNRGYVTVDAGGYWRLTTHWYRILVRHLRRNRLLFD